MKKYLIMLFFISSCASSIRKNVTNSSNDKLKTLAYCKCLEYSISNFVDKDTNDVSQAIITDNMDFYGGYFVRKIYPRLDSLAYSIYLKQKENQFKHYPVAEGTYGKVAYKLQCLDFYKSKQLDSLTKKLVREIKDSIYINKFYK